MLTFQSGPVWSYLVLSGHQSGPCYKSCPVVHGDQKNRKYLNFKGRGQEGPGHDLNFRWYTNIHMIGIHTLTYIKVMPDWDVGQSVSTKNFRRGKYQCLTFAKWLLFQRCSNHQREGWTCHGKPLTWPQKRHVSSHHSHHQIHQGLHHVDHSDPISGPL